MLRALLLAVIAALVVGTTALQGVRLADIGPVILTPSKNTTARRLVPRPQVACDGECPAELGWVRCEYAPSSSNWVCTVVAKDAHTVPDLLRADVACEGFDRPGDELVLPGSCGVKLKFTPTGQAEQHKSVVTGLLLFVLFVMGVALVIYSLENDATTRANNNDEAPPRYTSRAGSPTVHHYHHSSGPSFWDYVWWSELTRGSSRSCGGNSSSSSSSGQRTSTSTGSGSVL